MMLINGIVPRIEAMLAMAHVFIIHFFISHLRRYNFPMDLAMFEGSVDLEFDMSDRAGWRVWSNKEP